MGENDWIRHEKYVLKAIEKMEEKQEKILEKQTKILESMSSLKVKVGAITIILSTGTNFLIRMFT